MDPLVRDLVDMFPAAKDKQQQLSLEEAQELQNEKAIAELQQANKGEDEHRYIGNIVEDKVRARYGDEIEGQIISAGTGNLYKRNKASSKATVHYGNSHSKGSIFS